MPRLARFCLRWLLPCVARLHLPLFSISLAAALSGCSSLGVQPWERDLLAKPAMQLSGSPLEAGIDDHIYFSKEAATGGRSTGGGGCGCN